MEMNLLNSRLQVDGNQKFDKKKKSINSIFFVQGTNIKANQTWTKTQNKQLFTSQSGKEPEMLLLNSH